MLISTKGQYALIFMIDLAVYGNGNSVSIKSIAERQSLSEKYLEQVVSVLNNAGYVMSIRGAKGGYMIAGSPEKYTVGMVLRTVEGNLNPVDKQIDFKNEAGIMNEVTNSVWEKLSDAINYVVDKITLAELISEYNQKIQYNYVI